MAEKKPGTKKAAKKKSASGNLVHELGTHQIELEMQNEELRRAQIEFSESRRRYADLYDFSPVGYFTFDENSIVREANITGMEMLGVEKRLLLNKSFHLFIEKNEDRKSFSAHLAEVVQKLTKRTCELQLRGRGGTKFFARIESIPAEDDKGNTSLIHTAVSDITEQKQMETALRETNAELEIVNKELEAFSFTVANDLRAPLRSIEGFARALSEDYANCLDGPGNDYCKRINAATHRMNQLIDAMFSMAQKTRGQLSQGLVDLTAAAETIASKLKKQQPDRRVAFTIAKGMKVMADREMLYVVMENLIDNAWKFSANHPSAAIEVGITVINGERAYFVRDDGAGFNMEYAANLFSPFRRLHMDDEFPGVGIGLAVAHHIIRRHGGRMWAEAKPEKGATFYFTLE